MRPAWEAVSLGCFACGRIDWVQTVLRAMREFVEAVACVNIDVGGTKSRLRLLLHAAARSYSRTVATGGSYVNHLYSLRVLAQGSETGDLPVLI